MVKGAAFVATRAANLARIKKVDNQRELQKNYPLATSVSARGRNEPSKYSGMPRHVEEMQIALLQEEMQMHSDQLQDLQGQYEVNKQMYEERIEEYKKERDHERRQAEAKEAIVHELMHPHPEPGPPPLGPRRLRWVEGNTMLVVSSSVICFNLYTMVEEYLDPPTEKKFFWADQSFMVFYVFELVIKAVLRQRNFLCGRLAQVWWNWMDLIIVSSGALEMWIMPLCGITSESAVNLRALRAFRLLRLVRVCKVMRAFLDADLTWTDHEPFQAFMMIVIGGNAVIMGMETDKPDFWAWFYVEQVLLLIFMFELSVRLKRWGLHFFCHKQDFAWNWLDFTIVMGGVVDAYLLPLIDLVKVLTGHKSSGHSNIGQVMMMLRLARLLRILRLARLIKSIAPLYILIQGIAKAMQGMVWVVVLTGLLLYICALLGVKLIGHGLAFGGKAPPEMAAVFPDVLNSMFVLFDLMNGETDVMNPLMSIPVMKLLVMIYTIISTWAILSILTAVVSGNMIRATDELKKEIEDHAHETKSVRSKKLLAYLFEMADKEHDSLLTEDEFTGLLNDKLSCAMLVDASDMNIDDLQEMFHCLATTSEDNGRAYVKQADFIDGLQQERRQVSERSVMRLEKSLSTMFDNLEGIRKEVYRDKRNSGRRQPSQQKNVIIL